MKKLLIVFFLAAAIIFSLHWSGVAAASDEWPMYQANASHTGFVAISLEPGKFALRWQKNLTPYPLYPVTVAGGRVFASADNTGLMVLDSQSGDTIWGQSFTPLVNPPSYSDGKVYIQADQNLDTNTPGYLYAYDAATGAQIFRRQFSDQSFAYYAPTIYDGKVYILDGWGDLYCYDGSTGYQIWSDSGLPQYDRWTPAVDANVVYAYLGDKYGGGPGELFGIGSATGQQAFEIADPDFQSNAWTMRLAPVLGGMADLFAMNDGRLIRFDLNSRTISWVDLGDFSGQPTVAKGTVYAIDGGVLGAYDQKTGAKVWTWSPPNGEVLQNTIIATNTDLFVGSASNTYCIDLAGHSAVWTYPLGGYLTLGESTLYIAGSDGTLTAVGLGLPDIYAPKSVDFSPTDSGETTAATVPIINVGDEPLVVQSIVSSSGEFVAHLPELPFTLSPGQSVSIQMSYTPAEGGTGSGNLLIASNDPDQPQISVALSRSLSIVASAGAGGRISPAGTSVVAPGVSLGFTITPDAGYQLAALLVDGVNVEADPSSGQQSYSFDTITSDHTIKAVFTRSLDYFGAEAGDHFESQVTDASGNTHTAIDDISLDTLSNSLVDTQVFENTTSQTWYQEKSNELLMTQLQGSGQSIAFSPGLPIYETPLAAGKSWTATSSVMVNGVQGTAKITAVVASMTTVSVQAGHFAVWPITYTLTISGTSTSTTQFTYLFAPYIGTVKGSESGNTVALTSFRVGGGTVNTPPPLVTGVSPASGAPGTQVTINGFQLEGAGGEGLVMIGNAVCDQITFWSDTQIRCVVPQAASTGPVVVLTDTWASNDTISFRTGLWQNAEDFGGGWEGLQWFGFFYTGDSPWIYHQQLGWLYPFGTSTDSIWFYDASMNAFLWTSAKEYPYLYRLSDGTWLWYKKGTSNPPQFFNFKIGGWEND